MTMQTRCGRYPASLWNIQSLRLNSVHFSVNPQVPSETGIAKCVAEHVISLECKLGTERAHLGWDVEQPLDSIEFLLFSDKHVIYCNLMNAFSAFNEAGVYRPDKLYQNDAKQYGVRQRAWIHIGRTEFKPMFRKPESTASLSRMCSMADDTLDWADSRMISSTPARGLCVKVGDGDLRRGGVSWR